MKVVELRPPLAILGDICSSVGAYLRMIQSVSSAQLPSDSDRCGLLIRSLVSMSSTDLVRLIALWICRFYFYFWLREPVVQIYSSLLQVEKRCPGNEAGDNMN